MIKRSLLSDYKLTLAYGGNLVLLIALSIVGISSLKEAPDWAGEPRYLSNLRSSAVKVTPLSSDELTESGLRGWEIQHQRKGGRLFAYSPHGSESVIVGGTLFNSESESLGSDIEVSHQRQQLLFKDFESEASWLSLSPNGVLATPSAYLLIDPATDDARKGYRDLVRTGVDLSQFWAAAYPESDNPMSMPISTAIYESDYRTPAGASSFVTERRGGDLGFKHHSHEKLIEALHGESIQPLAPQGHPAEVQAIQSISLAIYLKDRLNIPANSVLVEKKGQPKGLTWEIYPLLPVTAWFDQLNLVAETPR